MQCNFHSTIFHYCYTGHSVLRRVNLHNISDSANHLREKKSFYNENYQSYNFLYQEKKNNKSVPLLPLKKQGSSKTDEPCFVKFTFLNNDYFRYSIFLVSTKLPTSSLYI